MLHRILYTSYVLVKDSSMSNSEASLRAVSFDTAVSITSVCRQKSDEAHLDNVNR